MTRRLEAWIPVAVLRVISGGNFIAAAAAALEQGLGYASRRLVLVDDIWQHDYAYTIVNCTKVELGRVRWESLGGNRISEPALKPLLDKLRCVCSARL